jgi:hypothetical protein
MEHVSLHSVGTYHKKFGWEKEKNKNILCRVSKNGTRQRILYRVSDVGHSTKITVVSYRRLLAALCRASLFAECLAIDKVVFVKCLHVPRILLSVNVVVTESRTLPSVAPDKDGFVECPTKNTQQSTEH